MTLRARKLLSVGLPKSQEIPRVTGQMPGAYRQSPNTGTTAAGGGISTSFLTRRYQDQLLDEDLCIPDPQGGSPMNFTAPPPRQNHGHHSCQIMPQLNPLLSVFGRSRWGIKGRKGHMAGSSIFQYATSQTCGKVLNSTLFVLPQCGTWTCKV